MSKKLTVAVGNADRSYQVHKIKNLLSGEMRIADALVPLEARKVTATVKVLLMRRRFDRNDSHFMQQRGASDEGRAALRAALPSLVRALLRTHGSDLLKSIHYVVAPASQPRHASDTRPRRLRTSAWT